MTRHNMTAGGMILLPDGRPFPGARINSDMIHLPHLSPHVEIWTLPNGEAVKVLVAYSCHCWTAAHDPGAHHGQVQILDGRWPRAHDADRFHASIALPAFIRSLNQHRVYVTASERNYGAYNASLVGADGLGYTAYFTVRQDRGRFDGIRHLLRMTGESAYHAAQLQKGSKTSLTAILSASLLGRTVKYRR